MVKKSNKKNIKEVDNNGAIYLTAHKRNIKAVYTINNGDVKVKTSVGYTKHKNTRKASAVCFQEVARIFCFKLKELNITDIAVVYIKGVSFHIDVVVKTIAQFFTIHQLNNITPYVHGGCKAKRQVRK